jgi:hypothetical protein
MGIFNRLKSVVTGSYEKAQTATARLAAPAALTGGTLAAAHAEQVTLPDTGIDVPGHITAAVTGLGAVLAVAIGAWFAFLIVKKGLNYARRVG